MTRRRSRSTSARARTKGGLRSICRRGSARKQASDEPSEAEEEDRGEQQDGGGGHGHVAPPDGDASPKLARLQPATAAPAQRPGRLPSTHGCDSAPVQAHQVRTLAQREAYLSDARCLARKLAGVYDSAPHSTA